MRCNLFGFTFVMFSNEILSIKIYTHIKRLIPRGVNDNINRLFRVNKPSAKDIFKEKL